MPVMPISLLKGDSHGAETDWRDAIPINMSAILKPLLGADGYQLQQPGLTKYSTGIGIDRGGIWNERFKRHYRISGGSFVQVDTDGTVTNLGSIGGADTVSLPYSFNTQGIVADGRFFLYESSGGLKEVVDSDLGSPIDCVWVDGYYFFTDGENIYHTLLTDEFAIDPLQFATAEFMPDDSLGVAKTADNKIMVFGRYTIEYFVNVATSNFAFQRVQARAVKAGIVGTHCKAELLDSWVIMGGRKEEAVGIHIVGVGSVTKISSREIDKIIGQYTENELSTSVLEARGEDAYQYLIVHLPNETLLYNVEIGKALGHDNAWSLLKSDVLGDLPWRAKHGVFEASKGVWVYGDKRDGTIGILDEKVSTHYDDIVEWVLNTPFVNIEGDSIDEIDLESIPGFTIASDATVFVSLTYNGVTHGKEYTMQYGKPSAYAQRFIRYRFGYVRDWFSIKFRGASRSRMVFAVLRIQHG